MKNFIGRELKLGLILAPIAVPLGIGLSYLALAAFTGSFSDGATLLLFSIICTLGISLILWLPIWYGLGYALIIGLRFGLRLVGVDIGAIFSQNKANDARPNRGKTIQALTGQLDQSLQEASGPGRDQQALMIYIKKAQTKGLNREQISNNLKNNGWSVDSISQAFQGIEPGV